MGADGNSIVSAPPGAGDFAVLEDLPVAVRVPARGHGDEGDDQDDDYGARAEGEGEDSEGSASHEGSDGSSSDDDDDDDGDATSYASSAAAAAVGAGAGCVQPPRMPPPLRPVDRAAAVATGTGSGVEGVSAGAAAAAAVSAADKQASPRSTDDSECGGGTAVSARGSLSKPPAAAPAAAPVHLSGLKVPGTHVLPSGATVVTLPSSVIATTATGAWGAVLAMRPTLLEQLSIRLLPFNNRAGPETDDGPAA
jgi:hypothetical protein